jgi:hypothetical protein
MDAAEKVAADLVKEIEGGPALFQDVRALLLLVVRGLLKVIP